MTQTLAFDIDLSQLTLRELVLRAQEGDRAAFGELFRRLFHQRISRGCESVAHGRQHFPVCNSQQAYAPGDCRSGNRVSRILSSARPQAR